ncbi:hypothetical protein TRFO_13576 [Tritrichomonas foetus]|uniref:Leucine Rich Repeat family protein n=1 Tax=Tritrichomonas foetus TaxID=1144522 RepID=A0A1J4L1S6_9EUKA|nr:hypothetical protein TRFO_13576 [Tritrichomonas foetus]|eukprot:OHT15924.1 hypothetical protein TRFO_13576 [Tritrichomonas foetus]
MRNVSKEQKALKSFILLVNPKAEPIIESAWVKKISTKNREDTRFAVATNSALYLCKNMGLVRNLRISHTFAWIDLLSFQKVNESLIEFKFKKNTLKLIVQHPTKFSNSIFSTLQRIIPQIYDKIIFDTPISSESLGGPKPRPTQFIDIFLSICHSKELAPNIPFFSHLRKSLRMGEPLSIIQGSFDTHVLKAAIDAFSLTTTIEFAIFGGFNFLDLYNSLGKAISGNKTVKKLKLTNYANPNKFENFFNGLKLSSITTLIFESVTFKINNVKDLAQEIKNTSIKSLSFIGCDFNIVTFLPILQAGSNFQSIDFFEISGDEGKTHFNCYSELLVFLKESQIKNVKLSQMGIDISVFFKMIQNFPELEIESLDLSNNKFCMNQITNYVFPETIRAFNLSKVHWEAGTFHEFLSHQTFVSDGVHIDFSQAHFNEKKSDLFEKLPQYPSTPMILRLNWNHNVITSKLIRFFAEYSFIEKASFDYCKIIPGTNIDELLESISYFISKTQLSKLSLKGTFIGAKGDAMSKIRNSLITAPSLISLDISDNKIGDRGLLIFKDIIMKSPSIGSIAFDGSEIKDPLALMQFFKEISNKEHLFYVSKPRRDMTRLITDSSSEKLKKELEDSWENLKKKIKHHSKATNLIEISDNDSFMLYGSTSFSSKFNSMILNSSLISVNIPTVEASWDLNINIGYTGSEQEWENLRQIYSISNLAGIQDLIENEKSQVSNFIL